MGCSFLAAVEPTLVRGAMGVSGGRLLTGAQPTSRKQAIMIEVYRSRYSPCNEGYPPDFGCSPRSHTSGNNCMGHSEVKFVHVTHLHKHDHDYGLPKDGAPPRQKGRRDGKEWEGSKDNRPPPGKKSGKICTPLKKAGDWVIPGVAGALANYAAEHFL